MEVERQSQLKCTATDTRSMKDRLADPRPSLMAISCPYDPDDAGVRRLRVDTRPPQLLSLILLKTSSGMDRISVGLLSSARKRLIHSRWRRPFLDSFPLFQTRFSQSLQSRNPHPDRHSHSSDGQAEGGVEKQHQLPLKPLKFQLFRSLVVSILLYGCSAGGRREKNPGIRDQVPEGTFLHLVQRARD